MTLRTEYFIWRRQSELYDDIHWWTSTTCIPGIQNCS